MVKSPSFNKNELHLERSKPELWSLRVPPKPVAPGDKFLPSFLPLEGRNVLFLAIAAIAPYGSSSLSSFMPEVYFENQCLV